MPTTDPDARIHIAVGIIKDSRNRYLVSQRPDNSFQAGKWEFPGGKLERGETVLAALKRELAEELAIDILEATPQVELDFDYPERRVRLNVWMVDEYRGTVISNEEQRLSWLELDQLKKLDLLEANFSIIQLLADKFKELS